MVVFTIVQGKVIVKQLPSPTFEVTDILPFSFSVIFRQIANPNPVPCANSFPL